MISTICSKFGRRMSHKTVEDPNIPLTGKNVADTLGWTFQTTSGIPVSSNIALGYSPVWSAVDQISSQVSRLPWQAFRRTERGRELLPGTHPVQRLLKFPDEQEVITINVWLTRMMAHALLHGNAFAKIWRENTRFRAPVRLEFIHSSKVVIRRQRGQVVYEVTWDEFEDGVREKPVEALLPDEVFHLQGLTINELGGLSLVAYARNTIARMMAAEIYGDDFLKNSAVPQGFFTHAGNISEEAQNRFISQMEKRFGEAGKRYRLGFLEEDMKWQPIGINPKDAMLVDMLKLGPEDVARYFSMPAHKLGSEKRTGWNTTEQENESWYNETIGRWTNRLCWESLKLFNIQSEVATHYTAFDTDQLIRANTKERYEAHNIAVMGGWATRNEVRARENMNPLPGLDEVLTPLNMAAGPDPTPEEEPDEPVAAEPSQPDTSQVDDGRAARLVVAHREVVVDRFRAICRRLAKASRDAVGKPAQFLGFINELEENHGQTVNEMLMAPSSLVSAITGMDQVEIVTAMSRQVFTSWRDGLLSASEVPAENLAGSVASAVEKLEARCEAMATNWITGG